MSDIFLMDPVHDTTSLRSTPTPSVSLGKPASKQNYKPTIGSMEQRFAKSLLREKLRHRLIDLE